VPNFQTKLNLINYLLRDEETYNRVIIFVSTKENAEQVFKIIKRRSEGEKRIMHSNKGQSTRINSINGFKSGAIRILITTDISSRGIDVELISHVINFDIPSNHEDYVHRIGRTARANNIGTAITLVNPAEEHSLHKIEELIRMKIPQLELPADLDLVATKKEENLVQ
jgi:ATP-dependent RNA helicase RhlE